MSKSIRIKPVSKIRLTPSKTPRIDPGVVASALGAEPQLQVRRAGGFGPITLYGVREALMRRRQSSGGRPALC